MMLRLVLNVVSNRVSKRCANTERSTTLLPGKLSSVFANPARGIGFEGLHGFGNGHVDRERDQHVDVVLGSSRGDHGYLDVPADAVKVSEEAPKEGIRDKFLSSFVLKMQWIRMFGYLCAMMPSLGDSGR
jgi:hypothetical protein